MMKYIVWVEPPLMFNKNRTRGHDVKEVVLPIGWRREKRIIHPEKQFTKKKKIIDPEKQFTIEEKKNCLPKNSQL